MGMNNILRQRYLCYCPDVNMVLLNITCPHQNLLVQHFISLHALLFLMSILTGSIKESCHGAVVLTFTLLTDGRL